MLTACKNDLPNPHKSCIRKILNTLVCHDNDLRRINAELRDLQIEFQQEMERIQSRYNEFRKPNCDDDGSTEKMLNFTKQINTIDEANECFSKRIDDLKSNRDEIINAASHCFTDLNVEKHKFKQFHESTIDYLKRYAVKTDDPTVIRNCEKDICEMHRLFVKEVIFIKQCETELLPFVHLCNLQDMCNCCCFKDYDWLPQGKSLKVVDEISDQIKCVMGTTITKAFAQYHVQQAADVKSFLAAYLMNLEHNEEVLVQKLNIFGNPT